MIDVKNNNKNNMRDVSSRTVQPSSFWGRHKVTIMKGAIVGAMAIAIFATLVFPPVGIAALLGKVTLVALPLVIKIMGLMAIAIVFTVGTICKVSDDENYLTKDLPDNELFVPDDNPADGCKTPRSLGGGILPTGFRK